MSTMVSRARGCLFGQLAGDALGSLVEFMGPDQINERYPEGVRHMVDGGTWDTLAGQPTDDSEMALALARTLVMDGRFDAESVRRSYVEWLESGPFDIGSTTRRGLTGVPDRDSQANGALMRVSPLGIFGAGRDVGDVALWGALDAAITHPNPVCRGASALFCAAVAHAVQHGPSPVELYGLMTEWVADASIWEGFGQPSALLLRGALLGAKESPPASYVKMSGWVLTAFQNAVWQMLHCESLEQGVVDTIQRGGDTDTNAAICGALLGAVHGEAAVPARWRDTVLGCRPRLSSGARRPRPEIYWPDQAVRLADSLIARSSSSRMVCP